MPNFDELLYDTDAGVVVNAIKTFFEMRKDSGKDFSLKQKTAIYLFNKYVWIFLFVSEKKE